MASGSSAASRSRTARPSSLQPALERVEPAALAEPVGERRGRSRAASASTTTSGR